MKRTSYTNESIPVACDWQGLGFSDYVNVSRLRVIDPGPRFLYRQHGRTHVSQAPLARVEFQTNEGLERGVARLWFLGAACVATRRAWVRDVMPRGAPLGSAVVAP